MRRYIVSNPRVLIIHKRLVFTMWFLALLPLIWQTMVVMRLNNKRFEHKQVSLLVKALENYPSYNNIDLFQKDAKSTDRIQFIAANVEYKPNVPTVSSNSKTITSNRLSLDAGANTTTPVYKLFETNIEELSKRSNLLKENNYSNNNIRIPNNVIKIFRMTYFPRNESTVNETDEKIIMQCKNIRFPEEHIQIEKMQWVESVNSTLVFSAYHDVAQPDIVKIIAICYSATTSPYYCQVWYKDSESGTMMMIITNATVVYMGRPNRQYSDCFIHCDLPYTHGIVAVSVVFQVKCTSARNLLDVKQITNNSYTRNFTMCLSALHSNYNRTKQLVEWIELNKILGAEQFVIYDFSSAHNVHKALDYYTQQGLVEVIQWSIPDILIEERFMRSQVISYFAQASAFNDCLLRSKTHSKYIVITDVDEFIVPHVEGVRTWIDMFNYLPDADSYLFKNCFFSILKGYSDELYPEKEIAERYGIMSLLVLNRHTLIWNSLRTKYIGRTSAVERLSTHEMVGGTAHIVDPSVGLLHHYRNYRRIRKNVTTDKTVLTKYGHDLLNSVIRAWKEIRNN